ncbi:MAG TPA: amidohydrolase, partial [Verrucomicrobiales bacterium]|nr:amidohydrolase [Verrucomicrobiales bacterium]
GSASLLAAAGCSSTRPGDRSLAIIDCHTHFFDPTRPEGVPWPGKESPLHKPTFVADYLAQPVPQPVTATVVVEASPWVEDNQWILDLAGKDDFIVGLCGNLDPMHDQFAANLQRFAANPLFRGIRVGGGAIQEQLGNPTFMGSIRRLADLNLQLDVNGPPNSLPAIARLAA